MVEMKTITYNGVTYEIVDEKARTGISELNEEIVDQATIQNMIDEKFNSIVNGNEVAY